jgi:hypothetical protein
MKEGGEGREGGERERGERERDRQTDSETDRQTYESIRACFNILVILNFVMPHEFFCKFGYWIS